VTLTASQSKIIIAGGTGFLGQLLSQSFLSDGHEVILFSRCHSTEATFGRAVFWDAENLDEWVEELDGANLLINLTGKSIDCRHTKANREKLPLVEQFSGMPKIWMNGLRNWMEQIC